ncbi:response regulator [Holophaga foetida]|uniref:response regulator n=1 Tax=Holophaga foetida TaxID=35839 RepID=UPI0002474CDE|nr:response regulator [Holophaga foetida]
MSRPRLLIVDDDPVSQAVLERILGDAGNEVVLASDGRAALDVLARDQGFDAILLDRQMPGMSGMEVLRYLKGVEALKDIPVVLQTAMDRDEEILGGMRAGALYYLTKPLDGRLVLQVVAAATSDYASRRAVWAELARIRSAMGLIERGVFRYQTLQQCLDLAALLAKASPNPKRAVIGLSELMINALEHGNLGITYEAKSALLESQNWRNEIDRRQRLPENADKWVSVTVVRSASRTRFRIQDMGQGFAWQDFQEIHAERMFDSHGRGILMAKWEAFDRVEYQGCGNCVVAEIGYASSSSPSSKVPAAASDRKRSTAAKVSWFPS